MKLLTKSRNFINLHESDVEGLIELALSLKRTPPKHKPLSGKSVGLVFMNPSLRTQTSFEVAAALLGAHPVALQVGSGGTWKLESQEGAVMDGDCAEHAKEAVAVLSRYVDLLGVRCFPSGRSWAEDKRDPMLSAFVKYATVPVVSLESALGHPCQALADLMTIREKRPKAKKFLLTWAPHIKHLPTAVPHSAAEMAALGGMDVTIARPEGYDLDPEIIKRVGKTAKSLTITDDLEDAYDGADVVYAKAWGSLENYGKPPAPMPKWRVTAEKMAKTNDAVFMHCLPVRRNVVVDDAVLDSKNSIVIDQAENRLHTAKAVLMNLLETK